MLRTLWAVFICLSLSGCSGWVSDERLFGPSDWAHLDLNGPYENKLQIGEAPTRTILRNRPDGLIEGTGPDRQDRSLMGFVRIRGGSGSYFLTVDRSDRDEKGDQYYIARLSNGDTLEFFLPDCLGTSPVEGMKKVRERWGVPAEAVESDGTPIIEEVVEPQDDSEGSLVCKFTTKDALMAAGLEAERFLSADHVVTVTPFATLSPPDEVEQAEEDE